MWYENVKILICFKKKRVTHITHSRNKIVIVCIVKYILNKLNKKLGGGGFGKKY